MNTFSDYKRRIGLQAAKSRIRNLLVDTIKKPVLRNPGYCPICAQDVSFLARDKWFRDHYVCSNCRSIPRERALMLIIETYFPEWRELIIHESSPGERGASRRLAEQASQYLPSQFFPDQKLGSQVGNFVCENLEALTFADNSIDLHITQDVFEHVFHPDKAFREIARTLKPGGAHIFTVPLVNKLKPSKPRALLSRSGKITHLETPSYHGNPISGEGSLVTMDWGFDICKHIFDACGLFTHLFYIDDISKGIRAEYIEVLMTVKP